MLTLNESTDYESIKSIITNPILWRLTEGQDKTNRVNEFTVDKDWVYFLLQDGEELVGCFQTKKINNQILEVHIFILPKYWGKGQAQEAVDLGHKWAKENGYLKTFTKVPANCIHVIKFLQQIDYKVCGMIEKGAMYNGYLVSLFLYNFEV